jgi:hypothetical protein
MMISAVIGFVGTVVYSFTLVGLNHSFLKKRLPVGLRPGWGSCGVLVVSCCAYLGLAVVYFWSWWRR